METYQEYKELVLACPSFHEPVVKEYTKTGKEKKPKKVDECPCKDDVGTSVPGYFSKDNVKLLFLLGSPSPGTIQEGLAWTGKPESQVIDWIKEAGFYGDNRIGFSYISKCPAKGFRALNKNYKYCNIHFKNELEIADNPAIVVVGYTLAKIILPPALVPKDESSYHYSLVGYDLNLFGRQHFFISDPDYIYTARGEPSSVGEYMLNISAIKKAASQLNISLQK